MSDSENKKDLQDEPKIVLIKDPVNVIIKKEEPIAKNRILSKEAPYILTFIIGILSFNFNFIIKDLSESPVIEYKFSEITNLKDSSDSKFPYLQHFNFNISNISKNIKFDSLWMVFKYLNSPKPYTNNFEAVNRYEINIFGNDTISIPVVSNSTSVQIPISPFQPNSSYVMDFSIHSTDSTNIFPKFEVITRNIINFKKEGFETFLIRNQLEINLAVAFVLILGVILVLIFKKYVL